MAVDIVGTDKLSPAAKSASKGLGGLVDGAAKFGLAAIGVGAALDVVGGAVAGLASDFIEAQKVEAQLGAVLESTGGVAGVTADAVNDLSNSLSKVTPFEDELITKTQSMLLTFTNVGKDVFPAATEAALNMATALGEDPVNAAMRLGKALNDPIQGVSALRRVGVQLTDQQEEAVKAMVAMGDTAGAQALILKELETEFGNSAKAAGQTFAGQLTILQNQFGNIKETIGGPIIGALSGLLAAVMPLVTAFGEALPGALEQVGKFLAPVGAAFTEITTKISGLFTTISTLVESGGEDTEQTIETTVKTWATAFVSWVGPMIPELLANLTQLYRDMATWVGEQVLGLATAVKEWIGPFLDWVVPMIPDLLRNLGVMLTDMVGWIVDTALPAILAGVVEWGGAFLGWIAPRIPPLLLELGKLLIELAGWMLGTALPAIIGHLAEWAGAFLAWIGTSVIPFIGAKLGELLTAIGAWIGEAAASLLESAKQLGISIVEGMKAGIVGAVQGVKDQAAKMVTDAMESARNALPGAAPSSPWEAWAKYVGEPIAEGTAEGIARGTWFVRQTAVEMVEEAVEGATEAAPKLSRFWQQTLTNIQADAAALAFPRSRDLGLGMVEHAAGGIREGTPAVVAAAEEMAGAASEAAAYAWDRSAAKGGGLWYSMVGGAGPGGWAISGKGYDWMGKLPAGHGTPGAPTMGMWKGGGLNLQHPLAGIGGGIGLHPGGTGIGGSRSWEELRDIIFAQNRPGDWAGADNTFIARNDPAATQAVWDLATRHAQQAYGIENHVHIEVAGREIAHVVIDQLTGQVRTAAALGVVPA